MQKLRRRSFRRRIRRGQGPGRTCIAVNTEGRALFLQQESNLLYQPYLRWKLGQVQGFRCTKVPTIESTRSAARTGRLREDCTTHPVPPSTTTNPSMYVSAARTYPSPRAPGHANTSGPWPRAPSALPLRKRAGPWSRPPSA